MAENLIEKLYVINLERRTDRRREILAELDQIGWNEALDRFAFFPAISPDNPGPFPNVGVRGCFLSHLGVLKRAVDEQVDILMMPH